MGLSRGPPWNLIQILFMRQCFPGKCLIAFDFCVFPRTVNRFRILLTSVLMTVEKQAWTTNGVIVASKSAFSESLLLVLY